MVSLIISSYIIVLLIGLITSCAVTILQNVNAIVQSQEHIACHPSLWNHVYNPNRLSTAVAYTVKKYSCLTIKGIIVSHQPHPDGDIHIWVKLDPGYGKYLTHASFGLPDTSSTYHGKLHTLVYGKTYSGLLIAEPICQHKATLTLAMKSCIPTKGSYLHKISIPPDGSHVCITGSRVTDDQHKGKYPKGWAEIHPVSNIHIMKSTGKC